MVQRKKENRRGPLIKASEDPALPVRARGVRGKGVPKGRVVPPVIIGWKEYVDLPSWNIRHLKAKIDTGARTSAIHASKIIRKKNRLLLVLHPHRKKSEKVHHITTVSTGDKWVTDSGGHRSRRPVVKTWIVIGKKRKKIEFTVTRRDNMLFRLILGRKALEGNFIVDPSQKYMTSKKRGL
ncbi:MAG: RimK/LysX family protein [Deltaproteobacteria bacterium]|nr:RimK/LysX family protein [Deltaproteobacteria bacterium]